LVIFTNNQHQRGEFHPRITSFFSQLNLPNEVRRFVEFGKPGLMENFWAMDFQPGILVAFPKYEVIRFEMLPMCLMMPLFTRFHQFSEKAKFLSFSLHKTLKSIHLLYDPKNMWKCKKCGEELEDSFDQCWQCGTPDDETSPHLPDKTNATPDQELASSPPSSQPKGVVLSHWYALIPGFNTSTKEFYAAVTKELKERQIPGLDISRVEFSEGGLLSGKREYLRMSRERLVFDICAAPFGKAYFFSCRFVEIPSIVKLWQLAFPLIMFFVVTFVAWRYAGLLLGMLIVIAVFGLTFYTLRNAVSMGLSNLDAFLIKDPIVGSIYERFFRKETYYREDTRLMYFDTVNDVVKTIVEETTAAKGVKLLKFNEHSPILGELYKQTAVPLPKQPA
jgi:hypothetical protein